MNDPNRDVCGRLDAAITHYLLSELEDESEDFLRAAEASGYVVFLVRPDGFSSFFAARAIAEKNGIELGFEPVEEHLILRYGDIS